MVLSTLVGMEPLIMELKTATDGTRRKGLSTKWLRIIQAVV